MSNKYIYACIRIPIEVIADGRHITHNDCTKIDFERCDELPPKSNLGKFDLVDIFNKLKSEPESEPESDSESESESDSEPEPMVLKSEIKTTKLPLKNSSFKSRKSASSSKYSQKRRSN